MEIFAWVSIILISLILLSLIYYLVVGYTVFKFSLARKNLSARILRKNTAKLLKQYDIDLCWWDKQTFKEVKTKSFDNLLLVGHYLENNSNKTVILVHGYGANYKEMQQYAEFFSQKNFNVLAVENRAHGKSEGKCIGMGWLDRKDILAWIDYLNSIKNTQILLFGLSMGAATVCFTVGEQLPTNVVGAISDCAFDNVERQFLHILKKYTIIKKFLLKHLRSYTKRLHDFNIKEADAVKAVKKTKIPILFIHGLDDKFVPPENLTNLFNSTPENLRDKLLVEGAAHAMSYPVGQLIYEKKINSFIKKFHLFY